MWSPLTIYFFNATTHRESGGEYLVDLIASDTYEWNERTLITSDRANVIAWIQQ
ncbi:unnamed protein product [Brassica rapa]|uniref:Uncharacterized protein n=1 Tax=Brassica campestris TaxID=3711 RepID=A0A3P5ZI05_BRACM|nr:unnamed protein product [Brassica rapa]VDC75965.1 unnamed protein product [Brassica rapa]